jgi:NADPH:quinone reductase-like Zn-dependent oxidoreductase
VKAVIRTAWGPPDVLRVADVERPAPRKGEVRIRIVATSVTASDCIARGLVAPARYRFLARLLLGWSAPRRRICGMVLAGEIESVGRMAVCSLSTF